MIIAEWTLTSRGVFQLTRLWGILALYMFPLLVMLSCTPAGAPSHSVPAERTVEATPEVGAVSPKRFEHAEQSLEVDSDFSTVSFESDTASPQWEVSDAGRVRIVGSIGTPCYVGHRVSATAVLKRDTIVTTVYLRRPETFCLDAVGRIRYELQIGPLTSGTYTMHLVYDRTNQGMLDVVRVDTAMNGAIVVP